MKVILDMVISPNGFIARENGDEDWLPSDGWDDFVAEAKEHNNIVMGRETYEQVTEKYENENFDNVQVDHKLIVTRNNDSQTPKGYTLVHSPEEAIEFLEKVGVKTLFLIGGGILNSSFAKRKLVNQVQLTVTPYIIGKGRPFLAFDNFEFGMALLSVKQLSLGRVRLVYKVNP
ncbi:dihydrofolate reductase family protein [Candidatus Parcubacteria bacterium]|nr:dihydrofolate reductase family protein [Candidatus Parcubacteria bacterium]